MRNVSDVNPKLPSFVGGSLQAERVVKILGILGVDCDHSVRAAINTRSDFLGFDVGSEISSLLQNAVRKVKRQVVLPQDREHIDAFLIWRAQNFNNFALGINLAVFP